MLVVRSDKYNIPGFCTNLVSIESREGGKKFYAESAKYVDVDMNMVFIMDGNKRTIVPTRGTIKRCGYGAVMHRLKQLFGTHHSNADVETAVVADN